jgi:F-type H+-transporting ATPase subunit epsilon
MAKNIMLEVVTPMKAIVSEETDMVISPGELGEFGVLIGHTPFLTTLKIGTLRYKDANGKERAIFVNGGFAEALPDKVTVLAESAERRKNIDIDRAKAAQKRAMDRLESRAENTNFIRAKASLQRAISRINLAQAR